MRRAVVLALATSGGAGLAPIAPGTFGAAVGVVLFAALAPWGLPVVAGVAAALLAAGIWAAGEAERAFDRHDDGRIVIDEVVGQLVALSPLTLAPEGQAHSPLLLAAGFLAFRLFDIWKPGPVRWAERGLAAGAGVMLDDVVAGALAAVVVAALALLTGGLSP